MAPGPSALPRRARFRDYFRPATFVFWGSTWPRSRAYPVRLVMARLALAVGLYFVRMFW